MKNFVIGAIVGALVGALVGYLVWGRQVSQLEARVGQLESRPSSVPAPAPAAMAARNPHAAVITVSGAAGDRCKAKIDPFLIGNNRNLKVHWAVDSDDALCASGNWRIELRFDNAADGTVWNGGVITITRGGGPPFKIPNTANVGKFPYHVWYVRTGLGAVSYPMADPELQIEM